MTGWIPMFLGPLPISWAIVERFQLIRTARGTSSSQTFPPNKELILSHSLVSICKQNTPRGENLVVIFPREFRGTTFHSWARGLRSFPGRSCTSFKHLCEKQLSDDLVLPAAPCWGGPEPICLQINSEESLGQRTTSKVRLKHMQTALLLYTDQLPSALQRNLDSTSSGPSPQEELLLKKINKFLTKKKKAGSSRPPQDPYPLIARSLLLFI